MKIIVRSFLARLGFILLGICGVLSLFSSCSRHQSDVIHSIAVLRPFGQHAFAYTASSIRPNSSADSMDNSTRAFYDQWKARYLSNAECGVDRYYVYVNADGATTGGGRDLKSISISEGHGYGMLITAFMAGYDPNAKIYFDGLYRMFKDHPSYVSPYLMAWNQVHGCVNAAQGSGTATDGDLDIAHALLLADKQWGSSGAINYLAEAKSVMSAILAHEVQSTEYYPALYEDIPSTSPYYAGTRPSDLMMDHFRTFAVVSGNPSWSAVLNKSYSLLSYVQTNSSPYGLFPDFIHQANTTTPVPAPLTVQGNPPQNMYLEGPNDNQFYYNACRVPWRIGTDFLVSGDSRAANLLSQFNTGIKSLASNDPTKIYNGYSLNGTALGAGNEVTYVAPAMVAAMVNSSHQAWLNAGWALIVNTPMSASDYYGNTLKLLSMIVISGNWWTP